VAAIGHPSARSRIFSALDEGLLLGQLEIKDRYGRHFFGKRGEGRPVARMDVHNDRLWIRIVLSADLGCKSSKGCIFSVWPCQFLFVLVAEGYMEQDFDVSDMKTLLDVRTLEWLAKTQPLI
jgi:hypothetical protein